VPIRMRDQALSGPKAARVAKTRVEHQTLNRAPSTPSP
jgi:hypothetical protein